MGIFSRIGKPSETGLVDPILTELVKEDKVPWYKKPNLRGMYMFLFVCCMGVEITSGFDSQLINTLQNSSYFLAYFGNGYKNKDGKVAIEPAMLGFINSCYQLGSVFAVPFAPWVAQRWGRRWSIMIGSVVMVVGALIQGFAQHVGMYIVARMLLGVGILFCIISGSSMIAELGHPKERPVLTSLFNASYFVGAITAAAITIGTGDIQSDWAWRIPSLLQMAASLLQITTVFFLPESPRWLVSTDRDDEAFEILTKFHAEGDANSVLVRAEMAQIRTTIKIEMEAAKQSWFDVLRTGGMRRRVFVTLFIGLFTQMSGNTLLTYYSGILFEMMNYTSTYAKSRINIANLCWNLATAVVIAIFAVRFPRRWAFMTSAMTMCLVFIAMTVSFERVKFAKDSKTTNNAASISALVWYFSYFPCYNIGNNALTYTYLVEIWPFAMRSRGIGVQQFFGKLAGFFSTNVNPIALDAIGWKFMAIYCGWIFFEFLFVFSFYPETYNRTLEELAFLFEGEEHALAANAAVEKQIHAGDHGPQDTGAAMAAADVKGEERREVA